MMNTPQISDHGLREKALRKVLYMCSMDVLIYFMERNNGGITLSEVEDFVASWLRAHPEITKDAK